MLKIWGRKNSNNVRKVLWCAEEAGLPYERIDAGGTFGRVNEPGYLGMNPNARIPVLEDGDLVLWESNAIVRYLAAAYSMGNLCPEGLAHRARADRWMDWATSTLVTPFTPVFWGMVRTAHDKRDHAAIARGIAQCAEVLRVPDQTLGEQAYLSGEQLGMGDIPLGCFMYAWFEMPIERPDLPNLQRWYESLRTRPAYQQAVMTELT
jgi:glutathione S-transferase